MGECWSHDQHRSHFARHRIELAVSNFPSWVPGLDAYHTSVVIDHVEYSFDEFGLRRENSLCTHKKFPVGNTVINFMGTSDMSGAELVDRLQSFFEPGTYDVIRKNCNAFSDCALFALLGTRLDPEYSSVETLGASVEKYVAILNRISGGVYHENPKARDFCPETVIRVLRTPVVPVLHVEEGPHGRRTESPAGTECLCKQTI
eukprot:TRINITY_DN56493_c0_g1_i1.p1 TRINITY_DN56493_c0_g1~~TRINITY_DN56493_c0_g1_i1.p1  ORF type:complete len:203 (-),score=13.78 TRINITY_DN56493_c0_g1_i1:32-640(-)